MRAEKERKPIRSLRECGGGEVRGHKNDKTHLSQIFPSISAAFIVMRCFRHQRKGTTPIAANAYNNEKRMGGKRTQSAVGRPQDGMVEVGITGKIVSDRVRER